MSAYHRLASNTFSRGTSVCLILLSSTLSISMTFTSIWTWDLLHTGMGNTMVQIDAIPGPLVPGRGRSIQDEGTAQSYDSTRAVCLYSFARPGCQGAG